VAAVLAAGTRVPRPGRCCWSAAGARDIYVPFTEAICVKGGPGSPGARHRSPDGLLDLNEI